jgi:hypothetical protein
MLTYSALFHHLRCDPKKRENLNYDLNYYFHHFRDRPHFRVDLETSEKHLDLRKHVDKSVLACSNIYSCLRDPWVTNVPRKVVKDTH